MAKDSSEKASSKIIHSFTGLRGLASIFVLFSHIPQWGRVKGMETLKECGGMSVYFFFVLSGYILMKRSLEEIQPSKEVAPKRYFNWKLVSYYVKRLFRIYPAYAASVLLYKYVLQAYATPQEVKTYKTIAYYDPSVFNSLTFHETKSHFWTMRVEMHFFFITLPPIIVFCAELMRLDYKYLSRSRVKLVHLMYAAVAWMAYSYLSASPYIRNPWEQRYLYDLHLPVFLLGVFGGMISYTLQLHDYKINVNTKLKSWIVELLSYALLVRIAFGNINVFRIYTSTNGFQWYQSQNWIAPYYVLLLLLLDSVDSNCSLGRFTSQAWAKRLGEISYSMYLIHFGVMLWMHTKTVYTGFDYAILLTIVCIFSSEILYRCVESPGVTVGFKVLKWMEKAYDQAMTTMRIRYRAINKVKYMEEKDHDVRIMVRNSDNDDNL